MEWLNFVEGLSVRALLQPIDDLVASARDGFRWYELFRLQGPEDLVHYADLEARSETPERFRWWYESEYRDAPRPCSYYTLFSRPIWTWDWYKTVPEHRAWTESDIPARVHELAMQRWSDIETARDACRIAADFNPLLAHELRLIDTGRHDNDRALREPDVTPYLLRHFRHVPIRHYALPAYDLIDALLRQPWIDAFTHRGHGDWYAIKLACAEQMRRVGQVPDGECETFPVRVLSGWSGNSCFDDDDGGRVSLDPNPAWAKGVRFQYEGLRTAGLFLDDNGCGGIDHGEMDRRNGLGGRAVVLSSYTDPGASRERRWYRHASGLLTGFRPDLPVTDDFIRQHGLTPCEPGVTE